MKDIIARLEAAEEGSRELDEMIAGSHPISVAVLTDRNGNHTGPRYTTSLDAALTLVPEGCWWSLNAIGFCSIWLNAQSCIEEPLGTTWPEHQESAVPKSPALALCIAALKARDA